MTSPGNRSGVTILLILTDINFNGCCGRLSNRQIKFHAVPFGHKRTIASTIASTIDIIYMLAHNICISVPRVRVRVNPVLLLTKDISVSYIYCNSVDC